MSLLTATAATAAAAEAGELDGESTLSPIEKDVLTELQKVLLTVNKLNEAILRTNAAITAVATSQRGAVDKGLEVLGGETHSSERE